LNRVYGNARWRKLKGADRTVSDEDAEAEGDIRIVDESGEDYLYSQDRFVPIRVPAVVRESFTTSAGVCGRVRV